MSQAFRAGGWRLGSLWILAFALPAAAALQLLRAGDWGDVAAVVRGISGLFLAAVGGVFAWALAHRRRPVIELIGDAVVFGSLYRARRRRVALVEVARAEGTGARLDLVLRSGEVLALPVAELSPGRRVEAREVLVRCLRRP